MRLIQTQAAMALAIAAAALCAVPAFAQAPEATEAPPAEAAAPTPEPPKVNIASAVTCQVLIGQFDDSVAAAKVEDTVKASARALRGDGNKACNAWNYEAGIGSVRVAIETIGRKPVR
jgi:glucose/arabinose dehydrogenase